MAEKAQPWRGLWFRKEAGTNKGERDLSGNKIKYTWHHLDDFVLNQSTGKWECTMQLVRTDAHGGAGCRGMTHAGAPAMWRAFFGNGY